MTNTEQAPGRATIYPEKRRFTGLVGMRGVVEVFSALTLLGTIATTQRLFHRQHHISRNEGMDQDLIARREMACVRQNLGLPFPDPYETVRGTIWDPNPAKGGLSALGGPDWNTASEEVDWALY